MLENYTPDDLTPDEVEVRNFKKSPLARRISDDILNPRTTRELLLQKKTQFRQLLQDKDKRSKRISESYFMETCSDPFHRVKMPLIRIFPSRFKQDKDISLLEASASDFQSLSFPNISEVFWNKIEAAGWKPETRQQATLTAVSNKLVLIGGVSRSINSDVNYFFPAYKKWEKAQTAGVEAEPRFGHSTVEYKKKVYVFGGGTDFNSIHKLRECLNGVKCLNIESKEWQTVRCEGSFIGSRKHHCAAVVGKHMFVNGGFNQKNNLLDDSAVLNLEKTKWKHLHIKGHGPGLIGFHTAAVVLDPGHKPTTSIYHLPHVHNSSVKNPGIYIFGGITQTRQASNELHLLNIGTRPLTWSRPETQGAPPSPRFQHSMAFNEKLNVIVIFGGRVDVSNSTQYTCFNDLYILKMDNLLWTTVRVLGNVPVPRSGHCTASIGSKIYLFAGVSTNTYCNGDLFMLELNPKVARHMIEDEEKRKAREIEIEILKARKAGLSQENKVLSLDLDEEQFM